MVRLRLISPEKMKHLENLSSPGHVISALAIDQRGSLKKMIQKDQSSTDLTQQIESFKSAVSKQLTPYASSILLDPEYGLKAARQRASEAGLLLAYEETGYDATEPGRLPDLLPTWSAKRLKEQGADAVKFLLYFDVDEAEEINQQKYAFVERIGSECQAEEIPFFLEIVTYDAKIADASSREYARLKPNKVNQAMKKFSEPRFNVDVLKVEVPVNMNYVASYSKDVEPVYTLAQAKEYFKEQEASTNLPYIYLSAGVSMDLFKETLKLAHQSGAKFNGVLCGRATWKDAVPEFVHGGHDQVIEWLNGQGRQNIEALNEVLVETASAWDEKVGVYGKA
ncbi:tagatose-bisphosphate aldolase [Ignavigranum ruoffiae]|nr:tagatose-bisphosphate aldolase [Ignavigranum ruoffiae]UPQ86333.1 tagatose-bisphosphate aldolase [Ignavigranum ruoffiae]